MKICPKCKAMINSEDTICKDCGHSFIAAPVSTSYNQTPGLASAAKVFMIIGTVLMGIYIIPLIWCIPMTCYYFKSIKNGTYISTGFKICCLLFVSLIGGIIMLCDKDN